MNQDLQSETSFLLLALMESDQHQTEVYLDGANEETERNEVLLDEFRSASSVDKGLLNHLDKCIREQAQYRTQYHNYARQNTVVSNGYAYMLMTRNLLPSLVKEANFLREITAAQNELIAARIERAESMYNALLLTLAGLVIAGIVCSLVIIRKLVLAMVLPLNQIRDASIALSKGNFGAEQVTVGADQALTQGTTQQEALLRGFLPLLLKSPTAPRKTPSALPWLWSAPSLPKIMSMKRL